ncbi:myotrophin isoform X2 [Hydra vulgaris]|uniref:Myotrophin isoform X2 n=1 Tax=Hydra vulgaris TaxID=6087 RepID=A0ABM4BDK3_HYDVU
MAGLLKWSVQNGDIEKVRQAFMQKSFDVNEDIGNGTRLIHCAADYGQLEIIDYLISIGANINVVDKHGNSPLLNAVYEGHTSCVKLLLDKGADKNIKSPSGETAFQVAETEAIKQLLK